MDNQNNKLITKEQVEDILNYYSCIGNNNTRLLINNLEHFQRAFVHESYYQSVQNSVINNTISENNTFISYIPHESNERLEYLGDHILKSAMGRYLFERFDEEREGFLTKIKIKIEKCSMLHKFAITLGFKKYLLLSLQVENQTIIDVFRGRGTPSFYEDAFEAFIGSIVLDFGEMGYLYADRFVRSIIENVIDFSELISKNDNFKDSLQRFCQSMKWTVPKYILIEDTLIQNKLFNTVLFINNEQFLQLPINIQKNIKHYNNSIKNQININPPIGDYIIGYGNGKKVILAEQLCAKQSMDVLNLCQDY